MKKIKEKSELTEEEIKELKEIIKERELKNDFIKYTEAKVIKK